jgi:aryl-alcohol dehydrogenase-like predicted oxidoreductase
MKWINKICIGAPQFSGLYGVTNKNKKKFHLKNIQKIFKFIKSKKINFLDTSLSYKKAETNIFLSKAKISNFQIITKIPRPHNESNYELKILKEINKSKNKFKIKRFNSILLHDSENLKKNEINKILKTLYKLKKKKLTKYIGFSIYNEKQYNNIIKYCTPDVLQVPANIFDRTFLEKRFLEKIKKKKIKLHVRAIFLQGTILADMSFIKQEFRKWEKIFSKWDQYCIINNYSKVTLATNFILNYKLIDKIIVGFYNINELAEFLKIKKITIKIPSFVKKSDKSIEKLIKPYNWI